MFKIIIALLMTIPLASFIINLYDVYQLDSMWYAFGMSMLGGLIIVILLDVIDGGK